MGLICLFGCLVVSSVMSLVIGREVEVCEALGGSNS